MHVGLGIPYAGSTVGFVVVLGLWSAVERALSIHSARPDIADDRHTMSRG
jgi:hypothetical protein